MYDGQHPHTRHTKVERDRFYVNSKTLSTAANSSSLREVSPSLAIFLMVVQSNPIQKRWQRSGTSHPSECSGCEEVSRSGKPAEQILRPPCRHDQTTEGTTTQRQDMGVGRGSTTGFQPDQGSEPHIGTLRPQDGNNCGCRPMGWEWYYYRGKAIEKSSS